MAVKIVEVPTIGTVRLYKRRDARSIRITVGNQGVLRVTLPYWTTYQTALKFVASQKDWISQHQAMPTLLKPNMAVGKAHRLHFISGSNKQSTWRLTGQVISVRLPQGITYASKEAQKAAQQGSMKALRNQAEQLLPIRLKQLAQKHSFTYRSVQIKSLRSRWGSCSQRGDITLNLYLMLLPWRLIDYVLLHELVHTKQPHHGTGFWKEFTACQPLAKTLRSELKQYQPHL